jgi:hypothetical protein
LRDWVTCEHSLIVPGPWMERERDAASVCSKQTLFFAADVAGQFLYRKIDPNYAFGDKAEEEIPLLFKQLRCVPAGDEGLAELACLVNRKQGARASRAEKGTRR